MDNSKKTKKKKKVDTNYKIYLNQETPRNGKLFTDNLFPPDENSLLGKDTTGKYIQEIEIHKNKIISSEIEWKRSKKILFEPHLFEGEISTNNLSTGIITNSYFLASVDALCKYPYLISKIFITREYNKDSCFFELLLFIDGEFQIVYLDDYFPCLKGTSVPYFTKPTTFELWFMLLEKAWAKVKGGYGNILIGNSSEVFRFLTGFSSEGINNRIIEEKNYLNLLKNCYDSKEVVCFSSNSDKNIEEMGLIKDHNYVLCDIVEIKDNNNDNIILFKLKNPISSDKNWKGDWSNESDNWTDEVNNQINEDILETDKNEFFINIKDLLKYFKRTDICHILFNSYSKIFDNNELQNLSEPQIFNFYLENQGKISITISENNWKFHKELKNYSHPTSLVLVEYDQENINIKNIYTDFENNKDIEKTILLNEGFYFLWIFKYFLGEEENINKNMKIKILSENKMKIKYIGPDTNFEVIQQIIYEQTKNEKKENLINNSEIFHYITNEFKDSGLAYRLAINPLSTCYQKWKVEPSETKDFTIISPKINPKEPFTIYLKQNNYLMIIAIRNKKYGNFIFNTKIEAKQYEKDNLSDKIETAEKKLNDFDFFFIRNINNLEEITNKEIGSFEELSKKEEYPVLDHATIFAKKYKEKCKLIEQVIEMEQEGINEKNKNLRWVKIKKDNGLFLGEADQNLPQGRGCFIYKGNENGYNLRWIGYFNNGEKSSYGKLYNDEGRLIYEGEYKNGLRNGEGTYYYASGLRYEGEFVNGLREGNGVFYWEDGTRWEGPFKNNEMNGEGLYYDKEESFPVVYNNGEIVE
jgi:hypothetical protein